MEEIKKQYYAIGEVSKRLEVQASVIRFWETEFPQIHPKKNRKGNRVYTLKDIETLEKIHYLLKVKKYTIKGAKELMESDFVIHPEEIANNEQNIETFPTSLSPIIPTEFKELLIKTRNLLEELKNIL